MWKRKRKKEWLPWYRARNFKGDLTEAEKRQLDAFRTQPTHPAARLERLPEEVGDYISRIELELYELKRETLFVLYIFVLVGAALPVLSYFGYVGSRWSSIGAVLALVALWNIFRRKRSNYDAMSDPFNLHAPGTDEEFRKEWELNYIGNVRRSRQETDDEEDL